MVYIFEHIFGAIKIVPRVPPASFEHIRTVFANQVIVSVPSGEFHTIVAFCGVTGCACVASHVQFVSLVLSLNSGCCINVKSNKEKKA